MRSDFDPRDPAQGMQMPGGRVPEIHMLVDRLEKDLAHHYEVLTQLSQRFESVLSKENQTARPEIGRAEVDSTKCVTVLGQRLESSLRQLEGCTGLVRVILNACEL